MSNYATRFSLVLSMLLALTVLLSIAGNAGESTVPDSEPTVPTSGSTTPPGETEKIDNGWAVSVIKAGASQTIVDEYADQLRAWEDEVTSVEKSIASDKTAEEVLAKIPSRLATTRAQLAEFKKSLMPKLEAADARLQKLGDAPKNGDPPEAEDVVFNRGQISSEVAAYNSVSKLAGVLLVRATQAIEAANQKRRTNFNTRLFRPAPDFFSTAFWRDASAGVRYRFSRLADSAVAAVRGISRQSPWWLFGIVALPLVVFFGLKQLIAVVTYDPDRALESKGAVPVLSARAARSLVGSLLSSLPYVAAGAGLYFLLDRVGILTSQSAGATVSALLLALCAVFFTKLVWRSLLPRQDNWALLRSWTRASRRSVATCVTAVAVVCAANEITTLFDGFLDATYSFTVLRSLVVALLIAIFASSLLFFTAPQQQDRTGVVRSNAWPRWVVGLGTVFVAAVLVSAAIGYVALALFISIRVPAIVAAVATFFVFRSAADHGVNSLLRKSATGNGAISDPIAVAAAVVLDLLLVVAIVPIALVLSGFDWITVRGWVSSAFFGFEIGGYSLSLHSVLIALGIFAVGLVLTRFVQRWFDRRSGISVLGGTGVKDSVKTILGYTGFTVSILAAISFLGLNLTNLAIVAGALSVGIGFGLQSIFNNFVSGLILLVERPIKVGDYIRVGTDEGTVRRVHVRATEIETLDRQSVIVPNARLITDPVVNWMHNDLISRIVISVGVSYSSDVDVVREVLENVAKNNHETLSMPAPFVYFAGYGNSSLDFELRVYIPNATRRVPVASELRFAIWHAFKEANIEIPFPQRDVHFKNLGDFQLPSSS